MASRAGGARGAISSLDLLSAAVERAEGGMAELATARAADHPSSGGLHTSRRGDLGGDNGPNDSAGEWSDGESIDSDDDEIDVEEVVRVVTRMAKEGPTITVVPVDRKHHDVNELVRLKMPSARSSDGAALDRAWTRGWIPGRTTLLAEKTRPSGNSCISLTRHPPDSTHADSATSSRRGTRCDPKGNHTWSFPTREAEPGQQRHAGALVRDPTEGACAKGRTRAAPSE